MVDNIQIPRDLTKIIRVEYDDGLLIRFLTDLLNRVTTLEKDKIALEARLYALEHP